MSRKTYYQQMYDERIEPLTWEEVKECCKTCPSHAPDGLPYMAWWSYCQADCEVLRSCPDVKTDC